MCHREHIHGLNRHRVIACGGEYFAVAGKRCGVAGDICDALGSAVYNCIKSGLFRSAARRIKQNCREAFAFRNEAGQGCFGILADEFRVFDVVELCIPTGILNGGRNRFNAQNGAGALSQKQGNRAYPAKNIRNIIVCSQVQCICGGKVQLLRLFGVHLQKAVRTDVEFQSANRFGKFRAAEQQFGFASDTGITRVAVDSVDTGCKRRQTAFQH